VSLRFWSAIPWPVCLAAARDYCATLVAVGSHGTSRLGGILAGSVATAMLHRAACSVLVARPPRDSRRFPARIAVGYDGSAASSAALSVALELGAGRDAPVVAVTANGAAPDFQVAGDTPTKVHVDEREPIDALLDAATSCDLLSLGARGLRGLRALGSVGERVAHRAPASVLVVRPTEDTIQGRNA
jgi:nucleotide-binding universal stress UspA family protein